VAARATQAAGVAQLDTDPSRGLQRSEERHNEQQDAAAEVLLGVEQHVHDDERRERHEGEDGSARQVQPQHRRGAQIQNRDHEQPSVLIAEPPTRHRVLRHDDLEHNHGGDDNETVVPPADQRHSTPPPQHEGTRSGGVGSSTTPTTHALGARVRAGAHCKRLKEVGEVEGATAVRTRTHPQRAANGTVTGLRNHTPRTSAFAPPPTAFP
jgi:hypothetical protein